MVRAEAEQGMVETVVLRAEAEKTATEEMAVNVATVLEGEEKVIQKGMLAEAAIWEMRQEVGLMEQAKARVAATKGVEKEGTEDEVVNNKVRQLAKMTVAVRE